MPGAFAEVSTPLALEPGGYLVIGKLQASATTGAGSLACELRSGTTVLDVAETDLGPNESITLAGTAAVAAPEPLAVFCRATGVSENALARAVQLIAVRLNELREVN